MQTVVVQFTDSTEEVIISYFCGMPPNPDEWPNLGEVLTSDSRWSKYFYAQSPLLQATLPAPQEVERVS